MANHKNIIPFILKFEGGYVNDPDDRGGATNKGVTIATYRALGKWDNNKDGKIDEKDLKLITNEQWQIIFKNSFWDKIKGDDIVNQSIADLIADWVWASGKYGITNTQKVLGVKQDGIVGAKTIAAINGYKNQKELFYKLKSERIAYVNRIVKANPSQKKFIKGWLNRINAIKYS